MNNMEHKLQWSRSLPDGVIIVVRGDEIVQFMLDVESMKTQFKLKGTWVKGKDISEEEFNTTAPPTTPQEPTREPVTTFEKEERDDFCLKHDTMMKERHGKNGATFYSHARKVGEEWEYCSGYGWGVKKPRDDEEYSGTYGQEGIEIAK